MIHMWNVIGSCHTHAQRWSDHAIRMPDNRLPKQILYSELELGKSTGVDSDSGTKISQIARRKCILWNLEQMALYRGDWRLTCKLQTARFAEDLLHKAMKTRQRRKKEKSSGRWSISLWKVTMFAIRASAFKVTGGPEKRSTQNRQLPRWLWSIKRIHRKQWPNPRSFTYISPVTKCLLGKKTYHIAHKPSCNNIIIFRITQQNPIHFSLHRTSSQTPASYKPSLTVIYFTVIKATIRDSGCSIDPRHLSSQCNVKTVTIRSGYALIYSW